MQQILVGTPATLSQSWYVDGTIVDPGAVTVTITKADGTALYTDASASGSGADARTKSLTASDTANLDVLTVVWTSPTYGDLTETVEIVGDLLFTEVEARAFRNSKLTEALASDAAVADARARISEDFEEILGVSPFPRYKLETLNGNGGDTLLLPDIRVTDVRSIEYRESGGTTWTAYTSTELADVFIDSGGVLIRESLGTFLAGRRNIRVGYEYGHERVPAPIKRAAIMVLHASEITSDIDPRAMSFSDGLGTIRFVTPGLTRGAWYDIPEVNATLQRWIEKVPVIG